MTDYRSPIQIGTKTLKNRITMAPTVKFYAGEDGMVTEEFVRHYEERAAHECALIVVEATCISKEGRLAPSQLGLWCDEQIDGHRQLVEAVHKHGALVMPQIHHGGMSTHPACGQPVGPSHVKVERRGNEVEIRELSLEEIHQIITQYIDAAIRAQKAGYDGVQIHGCHTYLVNDFASALNHRTDEYGGSMENLARFGCEIIQGIRKACGKDFLISMRISGCDPTIETAIEIAEYYVKAGCDYLQVSNGLGDFQSFDHDENLPYNRVAALGVLMHEHFKGRVPVSAVNGFLTPQLVRYMFEHDLVDTIDLARGLLADPALTQAILYDAPYAQCASCRVCAFHASHSHPCVGMVKRNVDPSIRF